MSLFGSDFGRIIFGIIDVKRGLGFNGSGFWEISGDFVKSSVGGRGRW